MVNEGSIGARLHRYFYGSDYEDDENLKKCFTDYVDEVKEYFSGRPDKLLVLDICSGERLAVLCKFLGRPVLNGTFSNITSYKTPDFQWVITRKVKAAIKKFIRVLKK